MSNVVRWNSINWLNEFDRMFERALPAARWETAVHVGLALDVVEKDEAYTVKASVPGISPNEVEITLDDNVLTIKGEVKADEAVENEKYHVRERRYGSFSRSIRFPVAVNAEAVHATYENGILTLTIPKAEEVKPKRIAIQIG